MSIAVPLALVCIFVVIVSVLYMRRRRSTGRKTTKESRANDNMSLPDSVVETSRPILVKNFADHYRLMSADSDFRYVAPTPVLFKHSLNMIWTTFFFFIFIDSAKSLKNWNMLDAISHAHLPICPAIVPRIVSQIFCRTIIHVLNCNQLTMTKGPITLMPIMCR